MSIVRISLDRHLVSLSIDLNIPECELFPDSSILENRVVDFVACNSIIRTKEDNNLSYFILKDELRKMQECIDRIPFKSPPHCIHSLRKCIHE